MKRILNNISRNVLLKIASLNSVLILIRIFSGFITSKVIAIYIGAEGLALIGNLRNFLTSVKSFSTLGLTNGIVKYVAELKSDVAELGKLVSTVLFLLFSATVIVSIGCYFFADDLNTLIFTEQNNYAHIIRLLAMALPFYSANTILLSVLNGFSKFKRILYINIVGQISITFLTVLLIIEKNIEGALLATVVAEILLLLISVFAVMTQRHSLTTIKFSEASFSFIKKLSSYSIMALFTAIFLPLVMVGIRNHIIETIGQEQAGFWEAMNRISSYYLMFISSLLTLYILPRFSEITTSKEFRREVFHFYKTIMPIFAIALIIIYILRSFVVNLVFTREFHPVENLFSWQLSGDFVKVLSLVISYQFLAKKMIWHYLITEFFSIAILYFSSIYFIDHYGVKGAPIGHFFTYIVYYAVIILLFWKTLFSKKHDEYV